MEVFLESFFAIDTDNSEEITVDELRAYMNKNNFDEGFVQKWLTLFDHNKNNVISLDEFCTTLGLLPKEAREFRRMSLHAGRRTLPPDVQEISADMTLDLKIDCVEIAKEAMDRYPSEREWTKYIKHQLDKRFERLWHVVIINGQYWIHFSHEPGYSFHFKIGRHIFLLWRTPAM